MELFEPDVLNPAYRMLTEEAMFAFCDAFSGSPRDVQFAMLKTLLPIVRVVPIEGALTAASLLVLITEGPEAQNDFLRAEAVANGIDLNTV